MKQKLSCILLIDDDEANNYLSNLVIEDAGCAAEVKTKQTAKAALSYLADSHHHCNRHTQPNPELIFLDINMPAMDGWEFLGKYRELINGIPQKSAPVIIMLSTSGHPSDRLKAAQIPEVAEFHSKPMTPELLHSIMMRYFPDKL